MFNIVVIFIFSDWWTGERSPDYERDEDTDLGAEGASHEKDDNLEGSEGVSLEKNAKEKKKKKGKMISVKKYNKNVAILVSVAIIMAVVSLTAIAFAICVVTGGIKPQTAEHARSFMRSKSRRKQSLSSF